MKQYLFDKLEQYGNRTALIQDNGESVTYEEVSDGGKEFSRLTMPRSLALILCKNTIGFVTGYLGFLRNRVVPILLSGTIETELFKNLLAIYHPEYVYMPEGMGDAPKEYSFLKKYKGYLLFCSDAQKQRKMYEELGLLLTTSGSTGSPKFVRQSYRNIQANAEAICQYLEIGEKERALMTLPLHYTYGLSILHSHMLKGAAVLLTEMPVFRKEFWEFVKKERGTSLAGVPYTYEMLKKVKMMEMELPSLKMLTQAGGKLPYELHKEFAEYAERTGRQFVVMYGQTEATARMSYLPSAQSLQKCGSIGIPIPGGKFRLLDADGNNMEQVDTEGELIYEGENVTLGYAECEKDLGKGDEWHGILYTGDLAKRDGDGFYYITGRKKRFLKIYGNRVNLDEIEQLLRNRFQGTEFASTGQDDRLFVFMNQEETLESVRKYLAEKTNINPFAIRVRYIQEIPKNSAGKILYGRLGEISMQEREREKDG